MMRTKTLFTLLTVMLFLGLAYLSAAGETTRAQITPPLDPTLAALGVANIVVSANADWTPVELDFDGVPMMLVPSGCFMMGMPQDQIDQLNTKYPGDEETFDALGPAHEVCLDAPFWLDKTEVTQAQFIEYDGVKSRINAFMGDNRPVERILWFEAQAHCEARGARLPTEAEWEYAARGPDALIYPWGDEFIGDNAVYDGNSGGETADVGSRPVGASWVGALDMAGNVMEWTSSLYVPYPYDATDGREQLTADGARVLRDGSWDFEGNFLWSANRNSSLPNGGSFFLGFRCARSQ